MFQTSFSVLQATPLLWLGLAFVLGSCIGSFINVVAWRLPIMLNNEWNQAASEQLGLSPAETPLFNLSKPASHCPHCQHKIRTYHNMPIFGWLLLGGRCADCKASISKRYPLVELSCGLMTAITAFYYPASGAALLAMLLVWILLSISLIDWDTQFIPDVIVLPLMWIGLLINVGATFVPLTDAVIGAAAGYASLWLCFKGFKLATGKDGMGYGDFKMLAALGAWFGWQSLPILLLVASISGASFGIGQRLTGKLAAQQAMPFGPWLAFAGLAQLWWGPQLAALIL